MSLAYWCVFVAALLPYVWVVVAKLGARGYNNAAPREYAAGQRGVRQRANWAQYNSFEAFPPFAAGVIIASQVGVESTWLNGLAVLFVMARLIYGIFYLMDLAALRSVVWFTGFAAMVALYIAAASAA